MSLNSSQYPGQALSCSNYVTFHPGGSMSAGLQLAPANPNRVKFTIFNSGSLALAIDHGAAAFNPNVPPVPGTSTWDSIIQGLTVLFGQPVPAILYAETAPVYTGPIYGAWIASGTLSGSSCVFTDYV